jgi:predicted anti-sigma-YlaC factor YlaD
MEQQTVGVSPKVVAAAVTTFVATVAVGFVANKVGLGVDVATVEALLLPLVTAVVTFVVGYLAKPGLVVNTDEVNVDGDVVPPPNNVNV